MTEESKARWYIIHTYSGFEQRVKQTIREMIRTGQAKGLVEDVVVPTEKVVELIKGQKELPRVNFILAMRWSRWCLRMNPGT